MPVPAQHKYELGDLIRLVVRFRHPVTGDWIQPDEVTCRLMNPDATLTSPAVTFDAELATPDDVSGPGYFVDVDAELPGAWYYRFGATGFGQAANEGTFYVEQSAFA